MKFDLVAVCGAHRGRVIPIRRSTFSIGRNAKCHLRPVSASVSDCHCTLFSCKGRWFVRDLNSACGTFVNRQKVVDERELADGDELKIGPLAFLVRIGRGDVLARPSPDDEPSVASSEEDVEEIAAAAYLAGETEAASPASADTGVIALSAADTETLPTAPKQSSSDAAQSILEEYRRRRKSKSADNKR